jgi:S-DNA-T family DNA segregation ATPase FtsK/SpoIIIE
MDLHVTVVGAPGSSRPPREIVVDTAMISTGAQLAERLGSAGWTAPFTVDGVLLAALDHPKGLYDGAVIVAGAPVELRRRPPVSHLAFVVREGPDAGQVLPLSRGVYVIGRAATDIVVADPALSRTHARLTVTEDSIVLEDLDSANGTFVDGGAITRANITVSSSIRMGASHCRLDLLSDAPWSRPVPASVLEPVPVSPELPRRPSRVLVLTSLLPLVLGVVLALTTGMWFFLAFSGLSAVTGLVPLLTYRRAAKEFAGAVQQAAEEDRRRRILAAPDPGLTGLDARRALHVAPVSGSAASTVPPGVVLLRMGTAEQPANLAVRPNGGVFEPPGLAGVPLLIACSAKPTAASPRGLTVTGDAPAVEGLTRALLLQASHPSNGFPTVVCWGSAKDIPQHARFLPNVTVTKDPRVLVDVLARPGLALVFHFSGHLPSEGTRSGSPTGRAARTTADTGSGRDPFVIRIEPGGDGPAAPATGWPALVLTEDGGAALIDGDALDVMPDAVSAGTFGRTARVLAEAVARGDVRFDRGRGTQESGPTLLPPSASLWTEHFEPANLASGSREIWASSDPAHPTAHLGAARQGAVVLDLVNDGPHLLVAGTTGSGKSEFLRTLVLGLAIGQPPENLTLLLIDYKGGSGLGDLAALPHCVGSMSDLSSESTARAFVSLRAELRAREAICADHGARDLDHLRLLAPAACPPRLVVVIDEFRMLIDDVPAALPDLLRVAALGRSLGVHLILATQKAQGAVPPDMRANITSTVLLRVRTALESQDLLGSAVAAEIPVDLPGRAYLRRGNEPPVEFQVATCSTAPSSEVSPGWQDLEAYIDGTDPTPAAGRSGTSPVLLREAVAALVRAAETSGIRSPRRPVLPPLPDRLLPVHHEALPPADPAHRRAELPVGTDGAALTIGLADLPHHQLQRTLQWRPREHSHLAIVGLPGSGGSDAVRAVVAALPGADPDVHLYLLDGDGSLGAVHAGKGDDLIGEHLGALVQPHETKRAGRVLERLAGLPPADDERHVVLAITGWGRWITQFREIRGGHAEEDLQAIIRDGVLSGVTVLILGDRDLTASRFFSLIPNRMYLPFGAHQEITLTWPKMPPIDPLPGRAFVQGRITGPWGDCVCQVLQQTTGIEQARPPAFPPFAVHPLPAVLRMTDLPQHSYQQRSTGDHLTLGVQGDELEPYGVTLNPGEVFLVLGHPGSGRTNALRLIGASRPVRSGRRSVLAPDHEADAAEKEDFWRAVGREHVPSADQQRLILLVDDADRLPADIHRIIADSVAVGAAAVLTARPGASLMARVPLALQARATGQGLVLAPRTPSDGDLFGVRLDVETAALPGRGVAVEPSGIYEVQTALVPADPSPSTPRGAPRTSTAFYRSPSGAR